MSNLQILGCTENTGPGALGSVQFTLQCFMELPWSWMGESQPRPRDSPLTTDQRQGLLYPHVHGLRHQGTNISLRERDTLLLVFLPPYKYSYQPAGDLHRPF